MAHDGAHVALLVVVLALRKTIVQQEHGTGLQPVGQCAHKGLALDMNFGQVVVWPGHLRWRAQIGQPVLPDEGLLRRAISPDHTTLMPHAAHTRQQLDGHGVEHLIADHHATHLIRQGIGPLHGVAVTPQRGLLALFQRQRQIHNGVAAQGHAQCRQRVQNVQRQCARAGAKLPHLVGAGGLQGLRHLTGQCLTKQRRDLGCGDKVAAGTNQRAIWRAHALRHGTKHHGTPAVVAQTWGIQSLGHEVVKTDPATAGLNVALQVCQHGLGRGIVLGQGWHKGRGIRRGRLNCLPSTP